LAQLNSGKKQKEAKRCVDTSEDDDDAISGTLEDGVDDVKLPWQPPDARD